jgi:putative heme-binding domain-containing protein
VSLAGVANESDLASKEKEIVIVVPKADPTNPNQIGNMDIGAAGRRALTASGDAARGETLFKAQSCIACHTTADGQTPKGPHLFEIGKRYKSEELVESILKPSAKLAQGYETYQFVMVDGRVLKGFVVSERADVTVIRESDSRQRELKKTDIEEKISQKVSAMPEGLMSNLTPEQLADMIAFLQSLR